MRRDGMDMIYKPVNLFGKTLKLVLGGTNIPALIAYIERIKEPLRLLNKFNFSG